MSEKLHVITGATGLIGSHIAEQLAARGERVHALVRPTSDTAFLTGLGIELTNADLSASDGLAKALAGADVLYHCAAKVDDCGPWTEFQEGIVDTTRRVMQAARTAAVERVVHVSSLAAYGHPKFASGPVTEDDPLAQNLHLWDYYAAAKAQSEAAARGIVSDVTIVRPSWSYGKRERSVFPRIVGAMQKGRAALLGPGDNLLNLIDARDVAAGAILAATVPAARGQAYNLASEGEITQRQMYDTLAAALELPAVTRRIPLTAAKVGALGLEFVARVLHGPRPLITRHGISLICRPVTYSIEKARRELSWAPQSPAVEGLERMAKWMRRGGSTP